MKGIAFFYGLVSSLITLGILLPASSQVTSDGTTNTKINQNGNNFNILDGIQRGNNLFHSFKELSIPTGGSVTFKNSTDIVNIINRVTGGNISKIDGLIKTNGNANLFLLNPNGILFGKNASLDIGGSFFATSADKLLFEDGFEFAAKQENTQPLLTISTPIGLQIGKGNQGLVNNQGVLTVNAENTITFLASEVSNSGTINAPSGNINLVGLGEEGLIKFDSKSKINNFNFSENITKGVVTNNGLINVFGETSGNIKIIGNNVELNQNTLINTGSNKNNENPANFQLQAGKNIQMNDFTIDANNSLLNVKLTAGIDILLNNGNIETNGGEFSADAGGLFAIQSVKINSISNRNLNGAPISITADSLEMQQAQINKRTTGTGKTGNINITAVKSIELLDESKIRNRSQASVEKGSINIKTDRLLLQDGSDIYEEATSGTLGGINITANSIKMLNRSGFGSNAFDNANGGTINLQSNSLEMKNRSGMGANTFGNGDAGAINIKTGTFEIENNSGMGTDSGANDSGNKLEGVETAGNAGTINIIADKIAIRDSSGMGSRTFGSGNAGRIIINTSSLLMQDSGLSVDTGLDRRNDTETATSNTGVGGRIEINADVIYLIEDSRIGSETGGKGEAGKIIINATKIYLNDSSISSNTSESGKAGTITLNADSLTLENKGNISSSTFSSGQGGNIKLQIRKDLSLQNKSFISVSSNFSNDTVDTANQANNQLGTAGNINIQAGKVKLDNQSRFVAETDSGKGGEINLRIRDFLLLRSNSSISTTAGIAGIGGNGGNISIQSPFVVAAPSENSDITANAFNGSGGKVEVNATGIFGLTLRTREDLVSLLNTDDPSQLSPEQLPSNDITAVSQTNPNLEGALAINTLGKDSIQNSIVKLPQNLIDTDILISNSCIARSSKQNSNFHIIGKSGFPYVPGEAVSSDYSIFEVRALSDDTSLKISVSPRNKADSIVEATGIYRLDNGQQILGRECGK